MEVEGYTKVSGKHGVRFMKGGRFVKVQDVPEEVKTKFDSQERMGALDPKACLFCGSFASETRFVNLRTIALCEEHYYDKNIGQIVQRLREIEHGQSNVEESSSQESQVGEGHGQEGQEL